MKLTLKTLTISKILFLLYVVYTYITSFSLFFIRGLSSALLLSALALALISTKFRFFKDKSLITFAVFAVYTIGSGLAVASNFNLAYTYTLTFVEFLISYLLILIYTAADHKIDFALNVFIVHGLVATLFMVYRGTDALRVSISENVNVNTIGTILVFSLAFILYEMIAAKKTVFRVTMSIGAILLLVYGIMMTVSKKSIIAGGTLIVLWIICCYKTTFARISSFYRALLFLALIGVGFLAYRWYTSNYAAQIQYMLFRMGEIVEGDSSQVRMDLIKEGWNIFQAHPILGVGFNNTRYYTSYGTYTHCFYTELLACTGVIGTLIFGYGMFHIWQKIGASFKKFRGYSRELKIQIVFMIIIFLVLLINSATQIILYLYSLMYVLAVLNAFGNYLATVETDKAVNG